MFLAFICGTTLCLTRQEVTDRVHGIHSTRCWCLKTANYHAVEQLGLNRTEHRDERVAPS